MIESSFAQCEPVISAGFGYEFDSLHSKKDELSAVLAALASDRGTSSFRWIFGPLLVPLLPLLLNLVRLPPPPVPKVTSIAR